MMNSKFIPLCNNYGLSGVIGDLIDTGVDNVKKSKPTVQYPIDMLINNMGFVEEEQVREEEEEEIFSAHLDVEAEIA